MRVTEHLGKFGITGANISASKNDKAKALRFSTLAAIDEAVGCQPADILEYRPVNTERPVARHSASTVSIAPRGGPAGTVPSHRRGSDIVRPVLHD
nr:helix-turn-helix domain-containing protein [Rhodococcus sp. MEB032]